MSDSIRQEMDRIYATVPGEMIPWNIETPPETLVNLVGNGTIAPCKAVDLGCGRGNYVMYLAREGFDVTGIDISAVAIDQAIDNVARNGINCRFRVADLLSDSLIIDDRFDFAFDWEVMHHIFPENRPAYFRNVNYLLNPGGRYLTVGFSENDPQFGGTGKYRDTPLGTRLYFSSETEMGDLLTPVFEIIELKTIEIEGKYAPHLAIYALAQKPA